MTEDDLVTLPASGERKPSSEWRVHSAIYAARPDVSAIVHTHSVHATAWSCLGEPLDTQVKEFTQVAAGPVRTAADAPPGSDELAANAVVALESRNAALLHRHGVLAVGDIARPRAGGRAGDRAPRADGLAFARAPLTPSTRVS